MPTPIAVTSISFYRPDKFPSIPVAVNFRYALASSTIFGGVIAFTKVIMVQAPTAFHPIA
jgi:hypothetical protein